ncbi:ATP-binding protein [Sulfitobacter sp. D35]|uniref:ATP-binding protein n=1 Tax=Sulfitobacter sp. D35 TaxID=3083252 RepID=UPI0039904E1C
MDGLCGLLVEIDGAVANGRTSATEPYALNLQSEGQIEFQCSASTLVGIAFNLMANASAALEGRDGGRLDIFVCQHDGRVFLQVADNGPGMPVQVCEWFVAVRRAPSEAIGSVGTGLQTVRSLVSEAGGTFNLLHTGGEGTRLGIDMPAAGAPRPDGPVSGGRVAGITDVAALASRAVRGAR